MAPNRIMRAGAVRRALLLAALAVCAAAIVGGCGDSGGATAATVVDKTADAEVLNEVLARQSAAVEAYDHTISSLGGPALRLGRLFRTQEGEHVDGTLKALRGLGAEAEPPVEEIPVDDGRSLAEHLAYLYELESATIEAEVSAVSRLTAPSARALLTATAANQAQHLVLLRRLLGAKPIESVPAPYEDGATAAP